MESLLLVAARASYLDSVQGRLGAMPQVTGIVRTGREEPRLALLVDVEGPEALRKLIANRVKLTTGVTECQHIEQPDPAMLALFAQASA